MLYRLELENFKPFGERQVLPLSRITLLYGPNSGGKSSVIQALLLLKQSVEENAPGNSSLIPRGRLIDLGSYLSMIHRHDLKRDLGFGLRYDAVPSRRVYGAPPSDYSRVLQLTFGAAKSPRSQKRDSSELRLTHYALNDGAPLEVRIRGHLHAAGPELAEAEGIAADHEFSWDDESSPRSLARWYAEMSRRRHARRGRSADDTPVAEEQVDTETVSTWLAEARLRPVATLPARLLPPRRTGDWFGWASGSVAPSAWLSLTRVLEGMAWEFSELLGSIRYLGPLRAYPERHYVVSGGDSGSVGTRGERTPEVLYRRRGDLTAKVNGWFERFEIPYELSLTPIADQVAGDIVVMQLVDQRTNTPVAPSDVGFGIGQLLPIVVEGCVAGSQILCVEQPEIHLHPRLQAHLADLLIATSEPQSAATRDAVRRPRDGVGNQWLVETHSEALVLRLQRRIREGVLRPDDVSVLYVEPIQGRGSVVLPLRLGEDGSFSDEWPGGFFEEAYTEMLGGEQP